MIKLQCSVKVRVRVKEFRRELQVVSETAAIAICPARACVEEYWGWSVKISRQMGANKGLDESGGRTRTNRRNRGGTKRSVASYELREKSRDV